jgi:hypothetical protein
MICARMTKGEGPVTRKGYCVCGNAGGEWDPGSSNVKVQREGAGCLRAGEVLWEGLSWGRLEC